MRGRCDHSPASPRLRLRAVIAPDLPKFVRDAIDRAARIYEKPKLFPEITGASLAAPGERIRKRRSSRLEAIALTAAALARRCDRRTLRIGDQRDDGLCNGVPLDQLQEHTGLSRWRLGRALFELEEAGYLVRHVQPVELLVDDDGNPCPRARGGGRRGMQTHRGFPAQRTLTPLFFQRLGFTTAKVKKARDRGSEDWKKRKARAVSAVAIHQTRREMRRLFWGASTGKRMPTRYYEIELALKARHPDWGIDRIRAEALRLLPR